MIGLVKSIRDRYNSFCFPLMGIVAGCGSARLERTVRVREVPGSNPGTPTEYSLLIREYLFYSSRFLLRGLRHLEHPDRRLPL
jgi:hypothetical protein